jgi:putative spermidine/putrescine transport system substrate-binding protein
MRHASISRRAVVGGALATTMGAGLARAQQAAKVLIAVYAGQDVKLWDRVVAQPFNKDAPFRVEIFESPMPAVAVAQSGGTPPFNAALMNSAQAYDLHLKGLLTELTEADVPAIKAIPRPLWPTTKSGGILGIPVHFSLYVLAYNNELAKASDFGTWSALVDKRWNKLVSLTRPAILARNDLTLFSKIFGGSDVNVEPGYEFIGKLVSNALNVYTSMASLMSQMGRGEVVAAPFFYDEVMHLHHQGVKNIDFVIPKEGALVIPYLVAIPKGAKDTDEAKKLLNALVEPKYQVPFLTESGLLPTNPDVPLAPENEKALGGKLDVILSRNVSADWEVVAANLEARTRKVEEIINKSK